MDLITDAENETAILNFKAGKQKTFVEYSVALRFLADAIHNNLKNADDAADCLIERVSYVGALSDFL